MSADRTARVDELGTPAGLARTHTLKTDRDVFQAVQAELKLFEIRFDDRGFQVGDRLELLETVSTGAEMAAGAPLEFTGAKVSMVVIHIMRGPVYGLMQGWVLLSIKPERGQGGEVVGDERIDWRERAQRAQASLVRVNAQAEHFERGWYLRGHALERLQEWAQAYPLDCFPEPDLAKAREVLCQAGLSLDALSAHAMRHVIERTKAIVDEGLSCMDSSPPAQLPEPAADMSHVDLARKILQVQGRAISPSREPGADLKVDALASALATWLATCQAKIQKG